MGLQVSVAEQEKTAANAKNAETSISAISRDLRGFFQKKRYKPGERDHVRPPSAVTNTRPSAVVTVAFSPSVALIA